jgi:hypothetical protein
MLLFGPVIDRRPLAGDGAILPFYLVLSDEVSGYTGRFFISYPKDFAIA